MFTFELKIMMKVKCPSFTPTLKVGVITLSSTLGCQMGPLPHYGNSSKDFALKDYRSIQSSPTRAKFSNPIFLVQVLL